jgi:hypothetical protein
MTIRHPVGGPKVRFSQLDSSAVNSVIIRITLGGQSFRSFLGGTGPIKNVPHLSGNYLCGMALSGAPDTIPKQLSLGF